MPDTKWTAEISAPWWFRVDCGPMFQLICAPNLAETAKIPNAYEEAGRIVTMAAAAPDLYEALQAMVAEFEDDAHYPHAGTIIEQAEAALLKANPKRKTDAQ